MTTVGPRLRHAAGLAFGIVLLSTLVAYIGPAQVGRVLASASPAYLALGVAAYAAFFVARGERWRLMLRPSAPSVRPAETASLTAVGWLVNSFVPLKAGEGARVALMARRHGPGYARVAGTVVFERVLDMVAIACAATAALAWAVLGGHATGSALMGEVLALAWTLPVLAAAVILTAALVVRSARRQGRVALLVTNFVDAFKAHRHRPADAARLAALSLLATALQILMFVAFTRALAPQIPLPVLLGAIPLFLLTFAVSVTPANLGTYELSFVFILALFGLDPVAFLPVAVSLHLVTISTVSLLGAAGVVAWRHTVPQHAAPPPVQEVAA